MSRRLVAVLTTASLLASMSVVGATTVSAAVVPTNTALDIAHALASSATVTGASFVTVPGGTTTPNGIADAPLAEFPTNGGSFAILTTGNVSDVPNPGRFASTDNGGAAVRGITDRDVTVLKTDITVPSGANCLTFDFKFLSEEFPAFVGAVSAYNDAFIAELDSSTWTTSGSTITAPNDFAKDSSGNVVSVKSVVGLSAANGAGTAFDGTTGPGPDTNGGATGLLHASTQVSAGAHSVYFSIFDQSDNIYDSAVFLDNLTVGFVPNPGVNCKPGATPVNFSLALTPMTATNPVGTPHTVTAKLTDMTGPIVGAPISFTVAGANPGTGSATTIASGEATFTYTGANVGQDQIAACYDPDNTPPCEATASATKDWVPSADLSLTKTGSPAQVTIGGDVTYTLTVHNSGPSAAADATVTDTLPAGTTFKSASAGCTNLAGVVTCQITGPIASGANPQVTIVATTSQVGAPCNTASVTTTTLDPNGENNSSSSACTTVNPVTATCPPTQACNATTTSPDGTTATITAGPGATITASFSTLAQAGFTACAGYAPPNPNSVLTFNAANSKLPKLIKFVETVNVTVVRICWNAPVTFRQRGGTWASPDLKGGFTGLLPDCLSKNPTLPCVSPPLTKNGITTLYILAPAGDPKMY